MIFEIEKDLLVEGMSKIVSITERRSPLPILTHALLETKNSHLFITATDLEVGIKVSYNCLDCEDGICTVPARKFLEIVKELSSGIIKVELQERFRLKITSGRSSFDIAGMDPNDFPAWSSIDDVESSEISCQKLTNMLDKTLFASSNDDSRFNLNGILIEKNDNKIRFVATDGHRLALIDEEMDLPLTSRVIVPKKGLMELKKLVEGQKDNAQIGFERKNMVLKTEKALMTIRLIEGDYPDYLRVLPSESSKIIIAKKTSLIQALKRMAIFTSDRNKGANMVIKTNQIEFNVTHPDLGAATDILEVEYNNEEEINLIVNVTYMIDAVSNVDSEAVTMEFFKEGSPVKFMASQDSNFFSIVMPMRK